ncbi:hypothetical protein AB5L52_00725 [Streptomyces sp. CG4]|uniref:hypothetical protein n=1 Tax=Streptomyces sp. CG4 TaxID=408783 RepID=UPI0034E1CC13
MSPRRPSPTPPRCCGARYSHRLPARLENLSGPAQGTIDLPLHVVWPGRHSYDLTGLKSRISLYNTALAEGQRRDLEVFLNRDLLISQ